MATVRNRKTMKVKREKFKFLCHTEHYANAAIEIPLRFAAFLLFDKKLSVKVNFFLNTQCREKFFEKPFFDRIKYTQSHQLHNSNDSHILKHEVPNWQPSISCRASRNDVKTGAHAV
ncbi:hypothetical protein NPIL_644761 [Nephila pilipes]|uniref:Uncharacterized protein n=1 Tax=Nephila pilipes TaxID=299642 RepID=A0A8X6NAI7_NEPPI|nr:hypothetical protein NPIL_644761 [Nephila pilipes]